MKKEIDLNGTVTLEATAMTDFMYQSIFGGNLTNEFQKCKENGNETELVKRICFVMAQRADLGSWRAVKDLTKDDYYDWLDSIDSYAIETQSEAIVNLYACNRKTKVAPKN